MTDETALRREIVRLGRLLYDRGLVVATEGNLSARLVGGLFLATPAGVCKGWLQPADLVVIDADGAAVRPVGEGRVSSEWPLHREIYRIRPDVAAVCHAHPPYATARAARRLPLASDLLTEIAASLGEVPLAPAAVPGTEELPAAVAPLVRDHDAILLANHGVVTVGKSAAEAYLKLEMVERVAQVTLLTEASGGSVPLSAAEAAAIRRTSPPGRDRPAPPDSPSRA